MSIPLLLTVKQILVILHIHHIVSHFIMTQLIYMASNPLSLYLIKPKNVSVQNVAPTSDQFVSSELMNKGRLTFLKALHARMCVAQ